MKKNKKKNKFNLVKNLPKMELGGDMNDLEAIYGSASGGSVKEKYEAQQDYANRAKNATAAQKVASYFGGSTAPLLELLGAKGAADKMEQKAVDWGTADIYNLNAGMGEGGSMVARYFTGDYSGMVTDAGQMGAKFTKTAGYKKYKEGNIDRGQELVQSGEEINKALDRPSSYMSGSGMGNMSSMFSGIGGGSNTSGGNNSLSTPNPTDNTNINAGATATNLDLNNGTGSSGFWSSGTGFAYGGDINPNKIVPINGPTHEYGGVPLDTNNDGTADIEAEGGESTDGKFIFSNRLKPQGSKKTFADISKSIENKYSKNNSLSDKTKEFELELLKDKNRKAKFKEELLNGTIGENTSSLPKAGNGEDIFKIINPEMLNISDTPYGMSIPTETGYYGKLPNQSIELTKLHPNSFRMYSKEMAPGSYSVNDINNDGILDTTGNNILSTPERTYDDVIYDADVKNTTNGSSLTKGDKWQLAGSAIGPASNLGLLISDSLQKPEKVKRQFDQTPLTKFNISPEEALKEERMRYVTVKNALSGTGTSARNANLANLMSSSQSRAEDIQLQYDEFNQKLDEAYELKKSNQRIFNIGQFDKYEYMDALNRAARRNAIRGDVKALSDTSAQGAKNVGQILNQTFDNNVKLKMLNEAFPNYKITAANMNEFIDNIHKLPKDQQEKLYQYVQNNFKI